MQYMEQLVTPELAQEWVEKRNVHNRPIVKAHVDALAREMAAWNGNGAHPEPLIFDRDGYLLDGQHRLAAVVKLQHPIPFVVCSGVNPELFAHINIGRQRSPSDRLLGVIDPCIVPVIRYHLRVRVPWVDRSRKFIPGDYVSLYERAKDAYDFVRPIRAAKKQSAGLRRVVVSVGLVELYVINQDAATRFTSDISAVLQGELPSSSHALKLQSSLIKHPERNYTTRINLDRVCYVLRKYAANEDIHSVNAVGWNPSEMKILERVFQWT